jgi:hypothetical protein
MPAQHRVECRGTARRPRPRVRATRRLAGRPPVLPHGRSNRLAWPPQLVALAAARLEGDHARSRRPRSVRPGGAADHHQAARPRRSRCRPAACRLGMAWVASAGPLAMTARGTGLRLMVRKLGRQHVRSCGCCQCSHLHCRPGCAAVIRQHPPATAPTARLDRLNAQLQEFYGPLYAIFQAEHIAHLRFVDTLRPGSSTLFAPGRPTPQRRRTCAVAPVGPEHPPAPVQPGVRGDHQQGAPADRG